MDLVSSAHHARRQIFQRGLNRADAFTIENLFYLRPELQSRYAWGEPANDAQLDIVFIDGDCPDSLNALVALRRVQPDITPIYVTRNARSSSRNCVAKPLAQPDLLRVLDDLQPGTAPRINRQPASLRVLVVDDDQAAQHALQRQLLKLSDATMTLAIESAADGREALHRLKSEDFDLVLLNAVLPGLDGYSTCERIKAISQTRVALMLHSPAAEDLAAGHSAGSEHCISKPPHPSDLRSIVRITALKKMAQA